MLYAGAVVKQGKNSKKPEKPAKTKKKAKAADDKNERVIADNRKARHNYHVSTRSNAASSWWAAK